MTTNTRMSNFKRMAERFSKEGKLLTALDKGLRRQSPLEDLMNADHSSRYLLQSHLLRLVLNPSKKAVSH